MYPTMYPWFRIYHKISHEPRRSSESLALTISPPSFTRDLPSPKLCFDISNNIRPTMAACCSSTRETFRPLIAKLLIRIVDRSWRSGERLKSLEIAWQIVRVYVCVFCENVKFRLVRMDFSFPEIVNSEFYEAVVMQINCQSL